MAAVPRGVGVVVSRWTVKWETTAGVRWMEQEAQSRPMALGKGCWLGLGWDGQRQRDEQRYVTVRSVSSRSLAASTLHIPDSLSLRLFSRKAKSSARTRVPYGRQWLTSPWPPCPLAYLSANITPENSPTTRGRFPEGFPNFTADKPHFDQYQHEFGAGFPPPPAPPGN